MGYNHAAAFIDAPPSDYIKPFVPWFGKSPMEAYKPKIDIVSNPINIGKTNTMLLDLRARWLDLFLSQVNELNPKIEIEVAVVWVDHFMPKTAEDLAMSLTIGGPEKLAFRLADAWDAA